jgi:hypothetical protein
MAPSSSGKTVNFQANPPGLNVVGDDGMWGGGDNGYSFLSVSPFLLLEG